MARNFSKKEINFSFLKKYGNFSLLSYLIENKRVQENFENITEVILNSEISAINTKFGTPAKYDAIIALKQGYISAKNGLLSAAFENSRFFLERLSLLKIISCMDMEYNPYEQAIINRDWHVLIDNKFTIYSITQFTGRLNHYFGKNFMARSSSIYSTGIPLCGIHSKHFKNYSYPINEIEKDYAITINEKCAKCEKKATRFVISLPKAGAIIGLLGYYTGADTRDLGKIYADYSRVLHPYGFYSYSEENVFNLWSLDIIRLVHLINKIVF